MAKLPGQGRQESGQPLGPRLEENLQALQRLYHHTEDLVIRRFRLGLSAEQAAAVVYLQGNVDENALDRQVIEPLARGSVAFTLEPDPKR
ncbi:MAG: hypothetical protein ACOY94_10195 [Bacillota bacterium]